MTADSAKFGQVAIAVGNTAQQIPRTAGSTGGVRLKAHDGNTNPIFIGSDNTVSATTGYQLGPGDDIFLEVLNLGKLWIVGATVGDRISYASVNA